VMHIEARPPEGVKEGCASNLCYGIDIDFIDVQIFPAHPNASLLSVKNSLDYPLLERGITRSSGSHPQFGESGPDEGFQRFLQSLKAEGAG
jgi:hypothetical protein